MKTSTNLVMEKRVNRILRHVKKLQDDEKPGKRKLRIGNMLRQMSKLKETMKKKLEEEEKKLEEEETMRKKKLEEEEKQLEEETMTKKKLEEEEKLKKWYEMIENDDFEKMNLEFESDEKLRKKYRSLQMYIIYLKIQQRSRELPMDRRMQWMLPRKVRCGGVPAPEYDRDDIFNNSVTPQVMAEFRDYAKFVIAAFNETHRTKYCVVEVVKVTKFCNNQILVRVDFTAKRDGDDDDDAKSFTGTIKYYGGVGKDPHVTYVDFTKT